MKKSTLPAMKLDSPCLLIIESSSIDTAEQLVVTDFFVVVILAKLRAQGWLANSRARGVIFSQIAGLGSQVGFFDEGAADYCRAGVVRRQSEGG